MTDEQIERVRADVGRRWGALETAVEDAAVEVDAEGQNGNLVRRAFEETRAAVEGEIEALTASNERLRQERNAAVTAADLAPVYEALEADNEHALAAKVQAAAQTIERLTARLATAEKAAHEWRERAEGGAGVLQQVEWWTSEHLSGEEGECPVCRSWQSDGHASECALASLLASYPHGA